VGPIDILLAILGLIAGVVAIAIAVTIESRKRTGRER
jgi:hypothetical protein